MDRVAILEVGDLLLVSIQIDLDDRTALRLQEDLVQRIAETGPSGVVIDISALDVLDSFLGRAFATLAATARVLDTETVVVGMRPAIAITLVELGLSLPGVRTALNLERGLEMLGEGAANRVPVAAENHRAGRARALAP